MERLLTKCDLRTIKHIRAIMTSSDKGLQELMTNLDDTTEKNRMRINVKKTKLMLINTNMERK